jgi:hypothetical protein
MFVYDFLQLATPFEDVTPRLLEGGGERLAVLGRAAYDDGEATVASFGPDALPGDRLVTVEFGRPVGEANVVVVPFRWRAMGQPWLFPAVDGHLELSRLGSAHTHVSLLANYTPPGGYFGRLADRMGLHHLVEAGVRTFLRRFAEGLTGPGEPVAA